MGRFARNRDAGEEQRATTLELFYDLVFVFAITQVSHLLLDDLTWQGAGEALLCPPRRLVGVELHDLGDERARPRLARRPARADRRSCSRRLLMAVAIPEAFGDRGLLFAGSYVAIQVGRHAFLTFAAADARDARAASAPRTSSSGSRRGRVLDRGRRSPTDRRASSLWLVALAIDYVGPLALYWVPACGRLDGEDLGRRDGALRRALPAVHDHRARRVDRDHRGDDGRSSISMRRV